MKKIPLALLTLLIATFLNPFAHALEKKTSKRTKEPKVIESEAGLIIQGWGIAIDALYDDRLDNLVKGYKILNVVVTNNNQNNILLDPLKDKWELEDSLGKKSTAINHLRLASEKLWVSLPEGLQKNFEYPQVVKPNKSAKITLFFPINTSLNNFKALSFKSFSIKKTFSILMSVENNLEIDDPRDKNPDTESFRQAMEKYEGPDKAPPRENEPLNQPQVPPESITIPLD
ncbi:hypothetical protein K1X76_02225 [bacterium]|nr:hypothetical protein [bacterium]